MTKRVRIRTLLIGGLFTLFFIGIVCRIYWVQVVEASWLVDRAVTVWENGEVLRPQRGAIVDRHQAVLAEEGPSYTVVVDPRFIQEEHKSSEVVRGLADILNKPESELLELVGKKREDGSFYRWVEVRNEGWKIDGALADEIKERFQPYQTLNGLVHFYEYGIYLEEKQKRYYPFERLAAHLLGYVDKEGKAVLGLEALFNSQLTGVPGKIISEKTLPNTKISYESPVDGKILKLTIDKQIQSYIEAAIDDAYRKWNPKSITVVAADPKTMEILGIANRPDFNPNQYWEFDSQRDFYNHAVSAIYEPGSTFKLVTLAATIEEGLFNPDETFQSGSIKVPGAVLHDHVRSGWGPISYLEGVKRSSNVGFVKLGYEKLGETKLKEYISKFGFGEKTGIDIPGEAKGIINFRYPAEIATATYGQGGVSVTTMQQLAAFGAIANGGKLMWPHVVKEIIDPKTNEPVQTFSPRVVRQVVSEQTAAQVSHYLEQSVSDHEIGTGRMAYIDGYRVAGKTGTANKVINGKYSQDKWLVSFIGYAPVEDPKLLIAVIADEADLQADYREGGKVTLPVFKQVMSQSLRYLEVPSRAQETKIKEKNFSVTIPDLSGLAVQEIKPQLERLDMPYELLGGGQTVVDQYPKPGTKTGPLQRIYVLTEEAGSIRQPNLVGKSMRDALELCALLNLRCEFNGEGFVASQTVSGDLDGVLVLDLQPAYVESDDREQAEANGDTTAGKKADPSTSATSSQKQRDGGQVQETS